LNAPSRSTLAAGIDACIGIVRFRKGPEDVPASTGLLLLALAGGVLVRGGSLALLPASERTMPVVMVAVSMGLTLCFIWIVVQVAGRPERFIQTATALFGAQVVLMPALLATGWFFLAHGNDPAWQMPAVLARLAVEVWVLLIAARIIRSATGWPMFACVGLAIAAEVLTVLLLSVIIPAPAGTTAPAPAPA
jgi:hypothetical protein